MALCHAVSVVRREEHKQVCSKHNPEAVCASNGWGRIVSPDAAEAHNRARSGCSADSERRRRDQLLQDRVRIGCPAFVECGARTTFRPRSIASAKCSDAPPHEHDRECAVPVGDCLRWHGSVSTAAVLPISTVRGVSGKFWGCCERPLQPRCRYSSSGGLRRGDDPGRPSVDRVSSWFWAFSTRYDKHPANLDLLLFAPNVSLGRLDLA